MFCVFHVLCFFLPFHFILFSFQGFILFTGHGRLEKQLTNVNTYLLTSSTLCLFVCLFVTGWIFSYFHQNIQFLAGKIINKIWTLNLSLLHKIFLFLFTKYYWQDKLWFKQIFPSVSWKALLKNFCFCRIL